MKNAKGREYYCKALYVNWCHYKLIFSIYLYVQLLVDTYAYACSLFLYTCILHRGPALVDIGLLLEYTTYTCKQHLENVAQILNR